MTDECPRCGANIFQAIYEEEIHDFDTDHKFTCPECGAKLLVGMSWSYYIFDAPEPKMVANEKTKEET